MEDSTATPDGKKQYSRRKRTPKKFFDFETADVDTKNSSRNEEKSKKNDNSLHKKSSAAENRDTENADSAKKPRGVSVRQGKKSGRNGSSFEGEQTGREKGEHSSIKVVTKVTKNHMDLHSKSAGEGSENTKKTRDAVVVRKLKENIKVPKSSSNNSGKAAKNAEDYLERIIADDAEVGILKSMVELVRNRPKPRSVMHVSNFTVHDNLNETIHRKVEINELSTKEKDVKFPRSTGLNECIESMSYQDENKSTQNSKKGQDDIPAYSVTKVKTSPKGVSIIVSRSNEQSKNEELDNSVIMEIMEVNEPVTKSRRKMKIEAVDNFVTKTTSQQTNSVTTPKSIRKKKSEILDNSVTKESPQQMLDTAVADTYNLNDSVTESGSGKKKQSYEANNIVKVDNAISASSTENKKEGDKESVSMVTPKSKKSLKVTKTPKRKDDALDDSVSMETPKTEAALSVSRSGRKRKVINYSAMDQNIKEETEMEDTPKQKRTRKSRGPEANQEAENGDKLLINLTHSVIYRI